MTPPKVLPVRPSLESLRKQAKKLAHEIAASDPDAIERARAQLPNILLPLSQRDAQLVLAREYGYQGWLELTAEVHKRLGTSIEWAASQARRVIHDNDVAGLKQLLAEYPDLLSWRDHENDGGLLGMATGSYGDSFDPSREQQFTRAACAELLIARGAAVAPSVCNGLIDSRARGMLELFQRKGLLPRTLRFLAALGDLSSVRACFDAGGVDLATVNEAFLCACRLEHETTASFLLDRAIELDGDLGRQIDGGPGRSGFIRYLIEQQSLDFMHAAPAGPWQAFSMHQVTRAIQDDDLAAFVGVLCSESWLLGDACAGFQAGLIERATLRDRGPFITALLDLNPALLRKSPPLKSQAIEFAFTYAKTHLIPVLTRVWPLPEDLPHAAGMGDAALVRRWFDEEGKPAWGDSGNVQQVLDTALAWAVLNNHFEIADFLLANGADINTNWSSHEPASILHELVFHENYAAMQFLIDRGIDMTIVDHRWGGTAEGWAYHAANNEKMAQWLAAAAKRRQLPNV